MGGDGQGATLVLTAENRIKKRISGGGDSWGKPVTY